MSSSATDPAASTPRAGTRTRGRLPVKLSNGKPIGITGRRWWIVFIAAAVALVAGCSADTTTSPQATTSPSSPEATATGGQAPYAEGLRASLAEIVKETTAPSAMVVVRSGRFSDATFSFGARQLGGTERVTAQDHFRVGSITKTMTATVILQLVQEGRLAVEDPVSKYVRDVPGGDAITIADLLDMRSGLYDYAGDPDSLRAVDADRQRAWQPRELLDIAFAHPAVFAPGSEWKYTNTNYILLGVIMEQLTGQSVNELFEQRLFTPLGMDNTAMPALEDTSIPVPFAHGYQYGSLEKAYGPDPALSAEQQAQAAAGTLLPEDWSQANPSWAWAAGAVISTPNDLVKWTNALIDGTLLDPDTQRLRLASPVTTNPGADPAGTVYGYGILKSGPYYGHGAQIAGYQTAILRNPDTDTTIVVFTTLTNAPDGTDIASALASAVREALG
jgi:D-alanyl-D-alanine carboxypeptidase